MEVWILDHQYQNVFTIDSFESIIWNEAYVGAGDFELIVPINNFTVNVASYIRDKRLHQLDTFASVRESVQVMVIEKIEMMTDVEQGSRIMLTGRSLESIIERRVIWRMTELDGDFQNQIEKLFNENLISPTLPERKIENFVFEKSDDARITELTLTKQFTGDNLYDAVTELCELHDLGFRVDLDTSTGTVPILRFKLYAGVDRSYDQTENPYVVFSPNFENLIASSLLEDVTIYKTVTLVSGEDEGHDRRTLIVNAENQYLTFPGGSGMSRRELFTDARDIQSEKYNDKGEVEIVPDDIYFGYLRQRGEEKLSENQFTKEFEGEVEAQQMFIYDVHFTKGDIVQIETEYGVMSKMRIMKMVRSQDESGFKAYPMFKILE